MWGLAFMYIIIDKNAINSKCYSSQQEKYKNIKNISSKTLKGLKDHGFIKLDLIYLIINAWRSWVH